MHVWVAVGVYVWLHASPGVTYDTSPAQDSKAACEAIKVTQKARNDANAEMIGYGIECVEVDVKAKEPVAPPKPSFETNEHTPGYTVGKRLFHDA